MTYTEKFSEIEITEETFLGASPPTYPTYESFYDKETILLVNEIFKKDFEVYGYKKDIL